MRAQPVFGAFLLCILVCKLLLYKALFYYSTHNLINAVIALYRTDRGYVTFIVAMSACVNLLGLDLVCVFKCHVVSKICKKKK